MTTMTTTAKTETPPPYIGKTPASTANGADDIVEQFDADDILRAASLILAGRVHQRPATNSPDLVRQSLTFHMATEADREVFSVLYLDSQHHAIEMRREFTGTINQTSVYPREIVKSALHLGAASVILCHNHPSGNTQPSAADIKLTRQLAQALALIDVRVLDHVIVTPCGGSLSMAEAGLMPAI